MITDTISMSVPRGRKVSYFDIDVHVNTLLITLVCQ